MNFSDVINLSTDSGPFLNWALSKKITCWFLLILIVPSILGSCLVLYGIQSKRDLHRKLNNHVVLCIFFVHLIQATLELPLTISYLYHGRVLIATDSFCEYWHVLISTVNIGSLQLNALMSIERYLLIFHRTFLENHKIIFHYAPTLFLIIAPPLYVFFFIIFYPCDSVFDYNAVVCGVPCFTLHPTIGAVSWLIWFLFPLVIVVISNLILIIRVILQKSRMLQNNVWKKNLTMVIQLLSVTGVLYISWLPIIIATVINILNSTPILFEIQANWLLIGLIYVAVLFSPITTTVAIPDLKKEIARILRGYHRCLKNTRIQPDTRTAQTVSHGTHPL